MMWMSGITAQNTSQIKGEPMNKSQVLATCKDDKASRYVKCPFCKVPMEWDDTIKGYECPVCRVTEDELDDMPEEMICGY
jgi:hypothetical protein